MRLSDFLGDASPEDKLVDNIFNELEDPARIIDDELRKTGKRLFELIHTERTAQRIRPYTPGETAAFLMGLKNAATFHNGDVREVSGESYLEGHLVPTVENLVMYSGITGIPTLNAGLLHDAHEDHKIPFERLLPHAELTQLLERFPDPTLDIIWIEDKVRGMVDGLTKVAGLASKEEKQAASFVKILEETRRSGPRVIIVKAGGDRMANIYDNLGRMPEKSRRRTLDEADALYKPFLTILGTRIALARMVNGIAVFDNQSLLEKFQRLVAEKSTALAEYREKILDVFSVKEEEKRGRKFIPGIVDVQFREPSLASFIPLDQPLKGIDPDTLKINPLHPLIEITILVEEESDIDHVIAHAVKNFRGRGQERDENQMIKRGTFIPFRDPRFGGNIRVRINAGYRDAISKRGILSPGAKTLPLDVERAIDYTLGKTKSVLKRQNGASYQAVFEIAQKEFLYSRIRVFTKDGDEKWFQQHSTVLDLARNISPEILIGLLGATMSGDIHGEEPEEEVFMFDELENEKVYCLESCLARNKPKEPLKIKVSPLWLMFCGVQYTRDPLLHYLRSPHSHQDPAKAARRKELAKKISNANTPIDEKQHAKRELQVLRSEEEALIRKAGENTLRELASLLSTSSETLLQLLNERGKELQREHKKSKALILFRLGRGDIDILQFLAETYGEQEKWTLRLFLPNIPGQEERFMQAAKFGSLGLNIDEKHFPGEQSPVEDEMIGRITISDHSGKFSAADFFKLFIKLKTRGFRVELVNISALPPSEVTQE